MKKVKIQKITFPIWGFMAASFLLLVILGILTYLNYNREGELMKQFYLHEGLTIISTLESGTRIGVVDKKWGKEQIQELLEESIKGQSIEYVQVVDEAGTILVNARGISSGERIENFQPPAATTPIRTKVIENQDGKNILQITKQSQSFSGVEPIPGKKTPEQNSRILSHGRHYVILGVNMDEFETARREDIRRALISAGILLILGSGTFYFLLLMQNYASVSSTLKNMETYTQNVVQSLPNGLISLDKEGRIETINPQAAKLLNLDAEEVKGKYLNQVLPHCNMEKTLTPPTDIFEQQMECRLNDGNIIPVSTTSSRLKDENGEIIGTVVILRDLREIRSLEKKIERSGRLASLGRMASGIAHEIRNPLSSIKGFAQYFRNKFEPDSEDSNYALMMAKEVDRLNRVIQELLNFARPQEANLLLVEIQPLLQHTLKLIQSDVEEKKIHIKSNLNERSPLRVLADSDMLTQVFLNLFINSVEAMDEGGELVITAAEGHHRVEIEVRDNGKGISRADLPKIFDPFYTTKKGGTGLGLAIVYRLVEQMQGEIEVESLPNQGTRFRLRLGKGMEES